ncbi:TolC family protein, partial [Comamonadaceae bacterium OH3737_COT-264]
ALALLLHEPPASAPPAAAPPWLPQEPQTLPQHALPDIPAGLPAQVLARRPDVQAAEQRLRATLADGDAARASYYPAISLTGSLNSASRSLGDVLANPIGALGASLALPFLRQQEMRLSNAAAHANYEAATLQWQKTLLTALQEVENALSRRTQLAEQRRWLEEQLDAARQAETLNETRYRVGATALKTWLDAQEARRSAELALAANQLSQLENQLTLYKALGGDALLPAPQVPDVPSFMQRP